MDKYTIEVKKWLNDRFKTYDYKGVYVAHQPIYGFRVRPSEPGHIGRYIITYRLLDTLRHLNFSSLLDVGGAEGYKAYLINKIFSVRTESTDISDEACRRATELFGLESVPSDIHCLPYSDGQFDVATCSETLEHVSDWKKATSELLRVASKAVVVTVPQDSRKFVEKNKENNEIHSHIHYFDSSSFDYLKDAGYSVLVHEISSSFLVIPACLVDSIPREHNNNWSHPKLATQLFNLLTLVTKRISGIKAASFIIWLDRIFCRMFKFNKTLIFIIMKNKNAMYSCLPRVEISICDLLRFSVPHLYQKSDE